MQIITIDKINLVNKLPKIIELSDNVWVAGGFVRDSILGVEYSDIDIFGKSKESLDDFIEKCLKDKAKQIYSDDLIKSFIYQDVKIQVIYRFFESIEKLLDNFDFTLCQFALDANHIWCNAESILHIFQKKIIPHKIDRPLDNMRRMQKYIQKGYSICNGGILQIINAIRNKTEEQINNEIQFYPDGKTRIIRWD